MTEQVPEDIKHLEAKRDHLLKSMDRLTSERIEIESKLAEARDKNRVGRFYKIDTHNEESDPVTQWIYVQNINTTYSHNMGVFILELPRLNNADLGRAYYTSMDDYEFSGASVVDGEQFQKAWDGWIVNLNAAFQSLVGGDESEG